MAHRIRLIHERLADDSASGISIHRAVSAGFAERVVELLGDLESGHDVDSLCAENCESARADDLETVEARLPQSTFFPQLLAFARVLPDATVRLWWASQPSTSGMTPGIESLEAVWLADPHRSDAEYSARDVLTQQQGTGFAALSLGELDFTWPRAQLGGASSNDTTGHSLQLGEALISAQSETPVTVAWDRRQPVLLCTFSIRALPTSGKGD